MKKVLSLVAAVMLFSAASMAQASFGVGYMNPTHPGALLSEPTTLNGVYAGLDYNIHFTENFGLAPGVFCSYATKTDEYPGSLASGKLTLTELYVGVPLNLNFSFKLAPDFALTLYAGPTISYGVMSKSKGDAKVLGIGGSAEVDLYKNTNYKPLDVLVGGGVAFDWAEMFRVSVGYNYGILDRNASDHHSFNRSYLHMGVAYLF